MYRIIGADGKEYGPITAEQLRRWIAENRANAQTHVRIDGTHEWKLLGSLPEFMATTPAAGATPAPIAPAAMVLTGRKSSGMATAGLVFGILSILFCCCCGTPFAILGIVFSSVALYQSNRYPDRYEGRTTAMIGLILSIGSLVFGGALLLVQMAASDFNFNENFGNLDP